MTLSLNFKFLYVSVVASLPPPEAFKTKKGTPEEVPKRWLRLLGSNQRPIG